MPTFLTTDADKTTLQVVLQTSVTLSSLFFSSCWTFCYVVNMLTFLWKRSGMKTAHGKRYLATVLKRVWPSLIGDAETVTPTEGKKTV